MAGRIRTGTRPAAQRYRLIRTRHCPDAILLANAARVAVAGGALPKREASRVANAEPPRYSVWCRNIRRQATRQYEKCGLGEIRQKLFTACTARSARNLAPACRQ